MASAQQTADDPLSMAAMARSHVYGYLARAFLPPGEDFTAAGAAVLEEEYGRTFGQQISQDCPLYETQFLGGQIFQQVQQLADIAGFYLAFGLEVRADAGERADHVSLELEFMQALTYREAYARTHHGPAEVELLRDAQRSFLRDHLARWLPTLARLVERKSSGFYGRLAAFAAAWVAAEAAAMGLPAGEELEYVPPAAPDVDAPLPCGGERCPLDPPA